MPFDSPAFAFVLVLAFPAGRRPMLLAASLFFPDRAGPTVRR